MFAEWKKSKLQREREARKAQEKIEREYNAEQAALKKAAAARERQEQAERRAAEKKVAASKRAAEQQAAQERRAAEKASAAERQRTQAAERAVAAEAARQRRVEAERVKAEKEQARSAIALDAQTRTEELQQRLAELQGVLTARPSRPVVAPRELEDVFNHEGVEAFCVRLEAGLLTSAYPLGVPAEVKVLGYRPEARELLIERELPRLGAIPIEREFRVVKGEVRPLVAKDADIRHRYGHLLARTALRTLAETFAAAPATLVDTVVLNGRVTAVDKATGKIINPNLLSVQFSREEFEELRLDEPELDPELCLRKQNALISPHPHDLVPVKPLLYYSTDRFKLVAGTDYLVDLDSRLDLLTLSPSEFEALIRQLFEARGLKAWKTQDSRDDGVDAVAVNEDPVLGGLAIIQAKRYSKVVPYESVTALSGVMHDKAAAKGIMVTTSWVGKASREFANRNGRMQIIEGRELKQMLAESLKMDVLISLPVVPPGWQRVDIA